LTLDRVSFWYPATDTPALRDVSLAARPGEVVALIGHIGAGTSTTLLVAADLAPRVIGGRREGTVSFQGESSTATPRGLVLPTPWTQLSGMAFTVWDEVAFGPANLGWPRERIGSAVDGVLARLRVAGLAARDPATLSGGELQRVIIAAVLAMDPELVLFDEPTAELDPVAAQDIWELIRDLARQGKTVLVTTTDLDSLPAVADRVVWLERGAVRDSGAPGAVLSDGAALGAGLSTTVAAVWREAGLALPTPLTVAAAVRQWR
jgi:energy-coupling factor transporter ATP-binding protein EcfA2